MSLVRWDPFADMPENVNADAIRCDSKDGTTAVQCIGDAHAIG
jgi:hypothetical protein